MAIELVSKIKPKNGGDYPMVDAQDVEMPDGTRLSDNLPVYLTQEEYDALAAAGELNEKTPYMIVGDSS